MAVTDFLETPRFSDDISYGSGGGPGFKTFIFEGHSGIEQRSIAWSRAKGKWDVGYGIRDKADMDVVRAFFYNVKGKAIGFRFKDWGDYSVTGANIGTGDGAENTFRLTKTYTTGANSYVRRIFKPVDGTVLVSIGGVVPTLGLSSDSTTGRVTFAANKTRGITAITKAVQAVISCAGHTFLAGESVHISGVVGMVEINGLRGLIVSVVANVSITVAINTAGFTAYTSGGTANTRPQSGEAVKGGCEFDLPCRFDSDVDTTLLTRSVREIGSMEVVELLNP
jgi:uncharacterized protein (TIGR02217 family)